MRNLKRRLFQAEEIYKQYNQEEPLLNFLKKFFSKNKKYGKNDRKEISDVLFGFFRSANLSKVVPFDFAAVIGILLQNEQHENLLEQIEETLEWKISSDYYSKTLEQKLDELSAIVKTPIKKHLFPFDLTLSANLNEIDILQRFYSQAHVFLRVVKRTDQVVAELLEANIESTQLGPNTLMVAANSKLEGLRSFIKGGFYIQDLASQKTETYFGAQENEKWWDACCGAGGKSILFKQRNPKTNLVASDVRPSILTNYNKRLSLLGFKPLEFQYNLETSQERPNNAPFDGILLDVPCSGSGTWRSNPEMLTQIFEDDIEDYAEKQLKLATAASKYVKPKGVLVYITCSVFKAENEDVVEKICTELGFRVDKMGLINEAEFNSGILFAARLIKV